MPIGKMPNDSHQGEADDRQADGDLDHCKASWWAEAPAVR
jgi:hypothetical protein